MASKLDPHKTQIEAMLQAGESVNTVAQTFGVARSTAQDYVRRLGTYEADNTGIEKVLFVPDTHAPYEDRKAWNLMISAAKGFEPDVVVHLGDLADFYSVSAHSKDPDRASRLKDELYYVKERRLELDELDPARKIFVEGNHCFRLERYIADKAPELDGLLSVDAALELTENGWEHVPYRQHTTLGKLYLTHDTGNGGKYTAARAGEAFQHSVVIGHHHQMQYFVSGDATGEHLVAAEFGWLGDAAKADYMHRVKANRVWSLGFGIGYHDTATGFVYLVPVPIVNYTACVEGKIYR